jgi:geranylgeranyl transferase type-2 subunit beta
MRRSGTNPTAAAVGVLNLISNDDKDSLALPADVRDGVLQHLAAMASSEGGLRANSWAPLADLLSTFTGLWTLRRLGALGRVDAAAALGYVRQLELPGGGFRGGLWDAHTDVEYTFYGLGCLGVLAPVGR